MSAISSTQASYLTSQISDNQLLFPVAGQTSGSTPLPAADLGTSPTTYSPSVVAPQSAVGAAYVPSTSSADAAALAALGVTSSGDSYAGEGTLATSAPAAATSTTTSTSSSAPAASKPAAAAAPTYAGESILSAKDATTAPASSTASTAQNSYATQYDNALVSNDETLLSGIVGAYGIGTGSTSAGLYGFGTSVGNNVDTLV